ncbi:hypothetical protein [Methylomonas rosea]|uniref:Uncharacterized protein n=1 Tax=Methylomonas rosea TaxID=2952227 RepID=A0ABT1TW13_9GAMM|nr:hypothetical protein [Methylomonas sp. WSC-7]MCQ8118278.1 hypothetical protein [Methylomonas sp. WSC-7]
MTSTHHSDLLSQLNGLNEQQLRRLLVEHLTKQKLGLYWEANAIERDAALNANLLPVQLFHFRTLRQLSGNLKLIGLSIGESE